MQTIATAGEGGSRGNGPTTSEPPHTIATVASRWRFRPPPPRTFRLGLAASAYSPQRRLRPNRAPCSVQSDPTRSRSHVQAGTPQPSRHWMPLELGLGSGGAVSWRRLAPDLLSEETASVRTDARTGLSPQGAFRCSLLQRRIASFAARFRLLQLVAASRAGLLIPRSQVRSLPGPSRTACKWRFVWGEIRGNRRRVNFRLLTRASTPEKARTSAS
jgi:hypothetical protein